MTEPRTAESRQVRCPYCSAALIPEPVAPHLYRFPEHRGMARMLCAGRRLPVLERDYITDEGVP